MGSNLDLVQRPLMNVSVIFSFNEELVHHHSLVVRIGLIGSGGDLCSGLGPWGDEDWARPEGPRREWGSWGGGQLAPLPTS